MWPGRAVERGPARRFNTRNAWRTSLSLLWAAAAPAAVLAGGNWPQFRGPGGSGVAENDDFPTGFGPNSNLVWKTALPAGNSSPCIWENRLFLTGAEGPNLETLSLDLADGRILWRHAVAAEKLDKGTGPNNAASPTPATDGQRVYAYFGPFGVVCYDLEGQEHWRRPLPPPITQHGVGTSPVLADNVVVLLRDQDVDSHLLALDKTSGAVVWRRDRPEARRGFSTPLVWRGNSPPLLVVAGTLQVVAYQLADGAEVWRAAGLPNELCASPVAGPGLIYAAGWTHGSGVSRMPPFDQLLEQADQNKDGQLTQTEAPPGPAKQHFFYLDADKDGAVTRQEYESLAAIFDRSQNALLAIRPGGRGEVTETHLAWKHTRGLPYVPSPLLYKDRVYLVKNGGLATCLNATNGTVLYQEERLGALGDYYSSPVAAHGKICVASQPGTLSVFTASDTLEVLARNVLGEPVLATPAIKDGRLYVRSQKHLYAFGPK